MNKIRTGARTKRERREPAEEKTGLHPRNKHRARYDFTRLVRGWPQLARFVRPNAYGDDSIDYFDPEAVHCLNEALLKCDYGISHWKIPAGYLSPPIPGRADYLHHLADLLRTSNGGKTPPGDRIRCLDVGTGANCVYPIIGASEYGWSFLGSDIDAVAVASAAMIVKLNPVLRRKIELRQQRRSDSAFDGIIQPGELFDASLCNPPFHASQAEARTAALRKLRNLSGKRVSKPTLNFGGKNHELWCEGGESGFVRGMIRESRNYSLSCFWFSTLLSKRSSLPGIYQALKQAGVTDVVTMPMGQGSKSSRIVAWTFLTLREREAWRRTRWTWK